MCIFIHRYLCGDAPPPPPHLPRRVTLHLPPRGDPNHPFHHLLYITVVLEAMLVPGLCDAETAVSKEDLLGVISSV